MLHLNDVTYRLGERLLLDTATLALPQGSRIGLVGRNGIGKTTLFRLIMGEIALESGSISWPKSWRVGTVTQEAPGGPESLLDVVLAADTERANLIAEAETADGTRRGEIEMRLVDIEAHSAPARAATILHGLGFNAQAQLRPCSDFSGGWRMRVALAAALFAQPDLLLLDEPTNHLDIEGTLWLYDYLGRYPHTVVIISHDRELLDTCVDHIVHMDRAKLSLYRGGYTAFEKLRGEEQAIQAKLKTKVDAERKHLQAFVDRFRAKASKAKQAQSRVKRLEKLKPVAAMMDSQVLPFNIPAPARPLSPPLIAMDRASVGYGDRAVLSHLDVTLLPDDRIALIGPNGNGKSTFCKLLAKRIAAMSGEVVASSKLKVAYFAQHQLDELIPEASAFAHVAKLMEGALESRIRGRCAAMGFPGPKADTPVEKLSGGEKARLMLGLATFEGPHLLILDEPTNHLDIDSRAALMEAVNDYEGAVLIVSHDRFLIEACAERLWLVGDGTVKAFDGDLDDYRKLVLAGPETANGAASAVSRDDAKRAAAERRAARAPVRKRIEAMEKTIERLTGVIEKVDAALAKPGVFQREPAKAKELARMRTEAATALARTEADWLEASAELEQA